jgi:hypothetical protein
MTNWQGICDMIVLYFSYILLSTNKKISDPNYRYRRGVIYHLNGAIDAVGRVASTRGNVVVQKGYFNLYFLLSWCVYC